MKEIIILYHENKNKPILFALSALKDFGGVDIDGIGSMVEMFQSGQDLVCRVPTNNFNAFKKRLEIEGFIYELK